VLSLSAAHRTLLSSWLPIDPSGARGLLYEMFFGAAHGDGAIDAARLGVLLDEVRAVRARYAGRPSILTAPVPVTGDDAPTRPVGDGSALSQWERAWLVVEREATDEAAFAALQELVWSRDALDAAGVFVLVSPSLDRARERVRLLAALPSATWIRANADRSPWVHWLAGSAPLPTVSAQPGDFAVVAALKGDWAECDALTHKRARRHYPRAIRIGPQELMLPQLLRQIWSHHTTGKPALDVLRKSLASLFTHWGRETRDRWHAGTEVAARLPLLGMIAALTKDEPLALLYGQRALNAHLVTPPAKTFTLPADVSAAYDAYEALLAEAHARGGRWRRSDALHLGLTLTPIE
jgi:hypothetical protein